MITLEFNVGKQILTRTDNEKVISNSSNIHQCHFSFSKDWDDKEITATFCKDRITMAVILDENNNCFIPSKLLKASNDMNLKVGVFGVDEEKVITSTLVNIPVLVGSPTGGDLPEVNYNLYEQIMQKIGEIKKGEVSFEAISDAVTEYLQNHPVSTDIDVAQEVADYISAHLAELKGEGIPAGGTTGQILQKSSSTDYDCSWATLSQGESISPKAVVDVEVSAQTNELAYKRNTNKLLTLYVDDCRATLPDVWAVAQEYNIPLNVACPTNMLNATLNNGQKVYELLHEMEDAGCEIHSHSIDYDTLHSDTTKEQALHMLRDSKIELLNKGFKVYGFCAPGGEDAWAYKWTEKGFGDLVRQYYEYSDTAIYPTGINLRRSFFSLNVTESFLDATLRKIELGMGTHKLGLHAFDSDLTEDRFRFLIETAQSKGFEFVTEHERHVRMATSIMEDRLQKIESIVGGYNDVDYYLFTHNIGRPKYNMVKYPYITLMNINSNYWYCISNSPLIADNTSANRIQLKKSDGTNFECAVFSYDNGWYYKNTEKSRAMIDSIVGTLNDIIATNFDLYDKDNNLVKSNSNIFDTDMLSSTFVSTLRNLFA